MCFFYIYIYPGYSDNTKVTLAMGFLNGWQKLHNVKKKGTGMDSNHTTNNKANEFTVVPLKKNFHEFYVASNYYYHHNHHNHQ